MDKLFLGSSIIYGDEHRTVYEWKDVESSGKKDGHGGIKNTKERKESNSLEEI